MRKAAVALATVIAVANEAHALQPMDCPNTGDTCVVPTGSDLLDFSLPFGGYFSDNIMIGQLTFPWGVNVVACVNGDVHFTEDSQAYVRSSLTHHSVVCTGSGNDTVKVLTGTESQWCALWGIPLLMAPLNYNGFELAIYGQGGSDTIHGGGGSDQICGGSGSDKLHGRGGINELNGGIGNDDLYGGTDLDYLYGADGDDILVDPGTGGERMVCFGGEDLPPSRIEGGAGNDCLQISPIEPGWCYGQLEQCNGTTIPCHGGIYCGTGTDRIDTPAEPGLSCEVVTSGFPCQR